MLIKYCASPWLVTGVFFHIFNEVWKLGYPRLSNVYVLFVFCVLFFSDIGAQREGSDPPPPPLFITFKSFTKIVYFSQYSPHPVSLAPPLFEFLWTPLFSDNNGSTWDFGGRSSSLFVGWLRCLQVKRVCLHSAPGK